jgi:hypothetical protein
MVGKFGLHGIVRRRGAAGKRPHANPSRTPPFQTLRRTSAAARRRRRRPRPPALGRSWATPRRAPPPAWLRRARRRRRVRRGGTARPPSRARGPPWASSPRRRRAWWAAAGAAGVAAGQAPAPVSRARRYGAGAGAWGRDEARWLVLGWFCDDSCALPAACRHGSGPSSSPNPRRRGRAAGLCLGPRPAGARANAQGALWRPFFARSRLCIRQHGKPSCAQRPGCDGGSARPANQRRQR